MAVLDLCQYPQVSIFRPHSSVIAAITQAVSAEVTTYRNHDLIDGTIIRFTISPNCGMQQINNQTAEITVTSPTTFTVPINTITFDPFIIPEDPDNPGLPPPQQQPCSFVVPIGERNDMLSAAVQNILP